MSTFTNTAREVEMPNGDVVVIHNAPTGGENTTSNIKKFKYDDNGHVTESTAADAEDLNLSGYSTPTTGNTDIGTSDDVQTAIGKLDHQSHIDQTNILLVQNATEELVDDGAKNLFDVNTTAIGSNNGGNISISGNAITVTGGSPWAKGYIGFIVEPDKDYAIRFTVTSNDSSNVYIMVGQSQTSAIYSKTLSDGQTGSFEGTFHSPANTTELNLYISVNNTSASVSPDKTIVLTDVMVTTKAKYDISPTYEPHAKSNAQLTRDCTVNNSRIYAQATEPTDTDIPEGSTWANGASVRGYERTDNLFDEKYTGITSATVGVTYYPIQVGTGDFTLSSTTPNSVGTGSLLFLLAGNVSDGASSPTNGVYNGMSRTVTAVDGYVTVAYRYDSNYNPKNYQTMLNAGSSALPYTPYLKWQADPALIEQVDSGAKNEFIFGEFNSGGSNPNVSIANNAVTVSGAQPWAKGYRAFRVTKNTTYVLSFRVTNVTAVATPHYRVSLGTDSSSGASYYGVLSCDTTGNYYMVFTPPTDTDIYLVITSNYSDTTVSDTPSITVDNIMVCSESDWKVSQQYEPYALPNTDLTRMVNDLQKKAVKVYTYHVNPNESDPEDAVTYLDDATGLTPAKMGASSFSYGSWANAWFLPRPCMLKSDGTVAYYLNPNDYSKKTDGTASDIADANFDGNVMLEFPKIWVKRVDEGNGARTVSIAPVNVDGTYKCWSNINADNQEVDHFYLPAYNGTIHSNKMRSLSGVTLDATYAPNYTREQEVTAATANNPSGKNMWYTETWADMCLVYDLLYLMGKSLDVQRTFGQGLSSGSETAMRAYVTGTHDAKGLFYGDISGTSTAVKVLGMENLWGCRWRAVAGLVNDNGTLKVKMTYGVADGSTAVGYNTTGNGYLNYGSTYGTNGYIKKMQADNMMGYKIIETAGTDATYYCNYYYVNNRTSAYALLGGSSDSGSGCGFYVNLLTGAGPANWSIGGALSCRPQVG